MKRLTFFLALLATLWFPAALRAQEDVSPLFFDAYECDFGEVEQAGGTLFQTFHFINGDTQSVRILRVSASCSCTSVSYPQDIIKGGDTGEISVAFNPAGTVGDVIRMVDIYLMDNRPSVSLTLKAHVNPSEYALEDVYPVSMPDGIRLTSVSQRFGYIAAGQMAERRIDIVNSSDKAARIGTDIDRSSLFLTAAAPSSLGPGEAGSIILRYTIPDYKEALGMHDGKVRLTVNGKVCDQSLAVSCIGIGNLEGAKGPAPSLQVLPINPVIKKSVLGKSFSSTYTIRNTGSGDLVIIRADLPDGASADLPDGTIIKPGGSRKVTVRSGSSWTSSGLVTNDPSRPYKEIRTSTK